MFKYYATLRGQARSQHACAPVSLNGRAGLVVSGGRGNGSSVEFWDMQTDKVSERAAKRC